MFGSSTLQWFLVKSWNLLVFCKNKILSAVAYKIISKKRKNIKHSYAKQIF